MLLLIPHLLASALVSAPLPQAPLAYPGDEGALGNDSYLPTSREAEEQLAVGDQALLRLREEATPEDSRARIRTEVLEAWHAALVESLPGASVPPRPLGPRADAQSPWPDPDGTAERRTEGVEVAVLRRLGALSKADRAVWTARFSSLAQEELVDAAHSPAHLAEVERRHPATPAAARAGLLLGEQALEAGRLEVARTWFERALHHVRLGGLEETLDRGLRQRLDSLDGLRPEPPQPGAWARATELRPLQHVALADSGRQVPTAPELGQGVRPGMCFLDDGLAVVQAPERVFLFDEPTGQRVADFQPNRLLRDTWTTAMLQAPRSEAPGWPLLPATDGKHLVLVQGRLEGQLSNVLMCTTIEDTRGPGGLEDDGPLLPRLRWALWETWRMGPSGQIDTSGLDLLPGAEFQPGPLVLGSQVLCQVRERSEGDDQADAGFGFQAEGGIRTWLVSFDLTTGRVLWKRFLTKGVELAEGQGRFGMRSPGVSSAQALVAWDGRVFAGSHTGAGVLLDAADGRVLWTLKNRRRKAQETGWSGARPPADAAGLLWAPADGDHAYWLRGDADLEGRGLFRQPPQAIGEGRALFAGAGDQALVLSRAGREYTLSGWDAGSGRRFDSPYLGPGETFTGAGTASAQRAYFATQTGLYLADRERELFLIDYAPLNIDGARVQPGGGVFAHGNHVYVVGPQMLWMFEVR